MNRRTVLPAAAAAWVLAMPAPGQWVEFVEESGRLDAPPSLGAADTEEKDYAWGDVDGDGDIDLLVVRKQPFTTTGRRANVLLMNESGVLTDRTAQYASASDAPGDQGFLTPTNDRDVVLSDVTGDGWLDIVTAVTLTDNQPRHLSHPRVYVNLGEIDGVWQGFRHEDGRIPQMHATAGPRFCAVSAGDVTGDGAPDLFFSDYDSGGTQLFDFNDRLLVNDGSGWFTDQTSTRLTSEMYTSNFGIANAILDMNGDGANDIVRLTSLGAPYHVGIIYNDPASPGTFPLFDPVYSLSPYHVTVGEMNGDGLLDLVVVDDGQDRYLLNQGNDGFGQANFSQFPMPPQTNVVEGGNVVIDDLDGDGWNDVIICDVDVDIPGCNNRTFIFHNQGDAPDVTFQEQDQVIPDAMLEGVYDAAVFDLDGNGRLDIVLGRCTGTQVWMNQVQVGIEFAFAGGLPTLLEPGQSTIVPVTLAPFGSGAAVEPGSGRLFTAINDGAFVAGTMNDLGGDQYEAVLPAAACVDRVRFYFEGDLADGLGTFRDPPLAPAVAHQAIAAAGTEVRIADQIEGPVSEWLIENDATLTSGAWEQAVPVGTIDGVNLAAPFNDYSPFGTQAFVTENGLPGGLAAAADVDGGPTHLISPAVDLGGTDGRVTYARWFYSLDTASDALTVAVSNDDGSSWTTVQTVTSTNDGVNTAWEESSFLVSDFVAPTMHVRVRFSVVDQPNNSVTEAAIDSFRVEAFLCPAACAGDVAQPADGKVNISDLLALLSGWGGSDPVLDITGDGVVNINDLLAVLGAWGPCP
jgi:hypothetical protein